MAKIGAKPSIFTKITRTETNGLSASSAARGLTKKDIREMVGRATDGGEDIVRFMVNVMQGRIPRVSPGAQVQAAEWLGAYFFGRPVETTVQVSMTKSSDGALPDVSDEQLEALIRGEHQQTAGSPALVEGTSDVQGAPAGDSVAPSAGPEPDVVDSGGVGVRGLRGGVVEGVGDATGDGGADGDGQAPLDVDDESV